MAAAALSRGAGGEEGGGGFHPLLPEAAVSLPALLQRVLQGMHDRLGEERFRDRVTLCPKLLARLS